MYRYRFDGSVHFLLLLSFHLPVVWSSPCFPSFSFFLTLRATSLGSFEGLPLLGLFSSPLIPSLRYLASQSEVHVLLLCSSFATRAGIIPSPSTLRTSNSLSFSPARDSFLYQVSNSPLLRVKTHSGKQINEQSYISSCTRNMTIPSIICKYTYLNWYRLTS